MEGSESLQEAQGRAIEAAMKIKPEVRDVWHMEQLSKEAAAGEESWHRGDHVDCLQQGHRSSAAHVSWGSHYTMILQIPGTGLETKVFSSGFLSCFDSVLSSMPSPFAPKCECFSCIHPTVVCGIHIICLLILIEVQDFALSLRGDFQLVLLNNTGIFETHEALRDGLSVFLKLWDTYESFGTGAEYYDLDHKCPSGLAFYCLQKVSIILKRKILL